MNTATDIDDDSSPPALWAAAQLVLDWLVSLYGGAVEILGMGMLAPKEHRAIASWLRPVEELVRRLLLIEAGKLPREEAAPRAARERRERKRRIVEHDPAHPETWHVSFRTLPPKRREATERARGEALPDLVSPWPLAERIEAVARVLADPAPYARKLAKRLARRPGLARRLAQPPPMKRRGPADWALGEASAQAAVAAGYFDTG